MTSEARVGYSVDHFRDSDAEIARLQQQATLLADAEDEAFRLLGFPDRGRVLDLGCGPGFVAARFRKSRPNLEIVGVDRDRKVLERARSHVEAFAGQADRLPFMSESFDCAYARLVLRHLPDPAAALSDLRRVLRPRGRAIVLDTDDGALILHPMPPGFSRALAARQNTFARRGADPFLARRLPTLLREAGFDEITLRTLVVDSVSVGPAAFAHIVLSPIADAIDDDLLGRPAVDEARVAVEKWAGDKESFGMTTVLVVGGTKV